MTTRVDQLSSATSIASTDLIVVEQGGVLKQGTPALLPFAPSGSGATERTAQAKLRDFVNVKDFGAAVDGVTNDYTALNNAQIAVNAAGGGFVYIPAGTLALGTAFTLLSKVILVGAGPLSTSIKWTGSNSSTAITMAVGATRNSGLRDLQIDCASATGMTGIALVDSQRNECRNVRIVSSITASGTALRLQAGSGGSGSSFNAAFNRFYDLEISGFSVGIQMDGIGPSGTETVATLNDFYGLDIDGAVTGIRCMQWCDSNDFHGVRINLTANNAVGVVMNDSATPAGDVGVYSNNFFQLDVDGFGAISGCSGILLNYSKQTQVYAFFHSPAVFPGTLINDNSSRSLSHYIVNNQLSAANNNIEIVSKGLQYGNAVSLTGTGSDAGQIVFPATANPSSNANTLDDYKEVNAWTPAFSAATVGDLAVSYSVQTGTETKIGRQVTLMFRLVTSAFTWTTSTGNFQIINVPVPSSGGRFYGALSWSGVTKAGYTNIVTRIGVGSSILTFSASGSGVAVAVVAIGDVPSGGTVDFEGTIVYEAAT